jgi:hypothetical protein
MEMQLGVWATRKPRAGCAMVTGRHTEIETVNGIPTAVTVWDGYLTRGNDPNAIESAHKWDGQGRLRLPNGRGGAHNYDLVRCIEGRGKGTPDELTRLREENVQLKRENEALQLIISRGQTAA